MSFLPRQNDFRTIAVVGGGLSGSLFALKLSRLRPTWTILLIEKDTHAGRGVAYGACDPGHLLNVPVSRMDIGLEPAFSEWLKAAADDRLADALTESDGVLGDAYVPRGLFGDYLTQQVSHAMTRGFGGGIRRVRGEGMAITASPRQVLLDDGRALAADVIVLATGNEPSVLPRTAGNTTRLIGNPWADGALDAIGAHDTVLLAGTGLTAVDIIMALQARGHRGTVHAVSRHGLLPQIHRSGGNWRPVLQGGISPLQALRIVRAHLHEATERNVPWQRVFDAIRPAVASVWHDWSLKQRSQFLRHLRALWDVHRHRMAKRVGDAVHALLSKKRLVVTAGRFHLLQDTGSNVRALLRLKGGTVRELETDFAINCTGPQGDIRRSEQPLLRGLLRQGLLRSDPLGLGVESYDCAVVNADGAASPWLFALGPLTRAAWWEITAAPEIRAQAERLARKISDDRDVGISDLSAAFLDIGAGI